MRRPRKIDQRAQYVRGDASEAANDTVRNHGGQAATSMSGVDEIVPMFVTSVFKARERCDQYSRAKQKYQARSGARREYLLGRWVQYSREYLLKNRVFCDFAPHANEKRARL